MTTLASSPPMTDALLGLYRRAPMELVRGDGTLDPATTLAGAVANHMRMNGVLMSTDGPMDNVLKIKPPMAFGLREADLLLAALQAALADL